MVLFLSFVLAEENVNDDSDSIITVDGKIVSGKDVNVIDVGGKVREGITNAEGEIKDISAQVKSIADKQVIALRNVNKEELRNRLLEFNKVRKQEFFEKYKEEGFKARVFAKEMLSQKKELLKNIKSDFTEIRKNFVDSRKELSEVKKARVECSEDCDEEIQQYRSKFKENMVKRVDVILKHLEKLKLKIESSESLTEEKANDLLGKINSKITDIEGLKVELENAETKEEILEVSKEIKNKWERFEYNSKIFSARLVNANLGNVILRSKLIEEKLNRFLERMEGTEKDTSEIDALVEDFHDSLASAEENYKLAHEKLKELKENDKGVSGVKEYIEESRNQLKEAKKTLKEIIAKIKELKATDELAEADEEVEAEEVEE